MADEPKWFRPGYRIPERPPKPGESLFEFHRKPDHKFFRVELRDHGPYGVEGQFFEGAPSSSWAGGSRTSTTASG